MARFYFAFFFPPIDIPLYWIVVIFDYHKSLFMHSLYFITPHCCIGLEEQVRHFYLIGFFNMYFGRM